MERYSGPHPFLTGFYHFLSWHGKPWGIELRLPFFAARLSFFADEGFTVVLRTPCCGQDLGDYWNVGKDGKPERPYRCSYCGRAGALPGRTDTWWKDGSTDKLVERLEYYFETWDQGNPLENELHAHDMAEILLTFETPLATLKGYASTWPRATDG